MDLKYGRLYNVQLDCTKPMKGIYLGKRYSPKAERNWSFLFKDSKGNPEVYAFDLDKTVLRDNVFVIHNPFKKKIMAVEKEFYKSFSENSLVKKFRKLKKQ